MPPALVVFRVAARVVDPGGSRRLVLCQLDLVVQQRVEEQRAQVDRPHADALHLPADVHLLRHDADDRDEHGGDEQADDEAEVHGGPRDHHDVEPLAVAGGRERACERNEPEQSDVVDRARAVDGVDPRVEVRLRPEDEDAEDGLDGGGDDELRERFVLHEHVRGEDGRLVQEDDGRQEHPLELEHVVQREQVAHVDGEVALPLVEGHLRQPRHRRRHGRHGRPGKAGGRVRREVLHDAEDGVLLVVVDLVVLLLLPQQRLAVLDGVVVGGEVEAVVLAVVEELIQDAAPRPQHGEERQRRADADADQRDEHHHEGEVEAAVGLLPARGEGALEARVAREELHGDVDHGEVEDVDEGHDGEGDDAVHAHLLQRAVPRHPHDHHELAKRHLGVVGAQRVRAHGAVAVSVAAGVHLAHDRLAPLP
mmetsp:Transcript_3863/g.12225  ORF Transcript_3863/g.12225 Transcript_3863/m.12225 type:complete len:423 (+) Transcript_3863:260-1528(+)